MNVKEHNSKELQELVWQSDIRRMQKMRLDETGRGWNINNSFDSSIQLGELLLVEDDHVIVYQYKIIIILRSIRNCQGNHD